MSLLVLSPEQLRDLRPGGWMAEPLALPETVYRSFDRPGLVERARRGVSRRLWAAMLTPPTPIRLAVSHPGVQAS